MNLLFAISSSAIICFLSTSSLAMPMSKTGQSNMNMNIQERSTNIVIVGGGISGLATALAIQKHNPSFGISNSNSNSNDNSNRARISTIHILEKSSEENFLSMTMGAGAQITPNALRALKYIMNNGDETLMNHVLRDGCTLEGSAFITPSTSPSSQPSTNNIMYMPDNTKQENNGLPQVFIRWSKLRHLLYSSLTTNSNTDTSTTSKQHPKIIIHTNTGKDIVGYKTHDNGHVSIMTKSGKELDLNECTNTDENKSDEQKEITSLLIAADGLSSTFRYLVNNNKMMLPSSSDVRKLGITDTGRISIKAVVPKELDSTKGYKPNHTYAYFGSNGGIGCFAGSAGDGYTYWAISIADEVDPITNEKTQFLSDIGIHQRNCNDEDEENSGDNLNEEECDVAYYQNVKDKLLEKLRKMEDVQNVQFVIDLIEATDPETIYKSRSKEAIDIGPDLMTKDYKCVLVGDAAHAMSGAYGQNPNLALEDAATLAICMKDSETLQDALKTYSESRVQRCLEMQRRSAERAEKAMKGEKTEDVSKWIFQWDLEA